MPLTGYPARGGARPPQRGGSTPKNASTTTPAPNTDTSSTTATTAPSTDTKPGDEVKKETSAEQKVTPKAEDGVKEEGEIIERPLCDILRGRNPIMFCNDQSKLRNLHMEWEQVSETGPPHDKTFTWSLKMGEGLSVLGSANSKKAAKNKAAEEMVKKLDQLPKLHHNKRNFNQAFGGPPFMMRGGGNMRGGGRGGFYGNMPPPPTYNKKPSSLKCEHAEHLKIGVSSFLV